MRRLIFLLPFFVLAACTAPSANSSAINPADYKAPVNVACVGDSITAGAGGGSGQNTYPDQLSRMMGSAFQIHNYGASGTTLLNSGDNPYTKQSAYKRALASNPDVVVLMLGTNDTKSQNWKFKDQIPADLKSLVQSFADLPSKPRIFLCLPCPVTGDNRYGITEAGVMAEIPVFEAAAKDLHLTVIDVHSAMLHQDALFGDHVHPTREGYTLLAKIIYHALTGKDYSGPDPAHEVPARAAART